jgi:hypothetical protein
MSEKTHSRCESCLKSVRWVPFVGGLLWLAVSPTRVASQTSPSAASGPQAVLSAAPTVSLPGVVDSNSPAVWDLDGGLSKLFVLTSASGAPSLAAGADVTRLGGAGKVTFTSHPGNGVWMEAVVADEDGTWYGYYHNENPAVVCGRPNRAIARIGAARSEDRGRTWEDLGIILEAATGTIACGSQNRYVIGGVGDLSVALNTDRTYLYIFFSQYQKDPAAQGVAVARMTWANRDRPVGRVLVWDKGVWLPSRINRTPTVDVNGVLRTIWREFPTGSPIMAAAEPWHDADTEVDAFWGPSVHWNEFLQMYVMLLNHARDENYTQEGIYVSFAPRLSDPTLWSPPQKILPGGRWYPQVMGLEPGAGTDKLAGATARFFMQGRSEYFVTFLR